MEHSLVWRYNDEMGDMATGVSLLITGLFSDAVSSSACI